MGLARQYGLGLEIQTFAYPDVLNTDWRPLVKHYKQALFNLPGERAMHGPFIDMSSGSPDPLIREVVRHRILTALETASELEIPKLVFHANFIATMRNLSYRQEFMHYQFDFWNMILPRAVELGVTIVLENMWEFEPFIISELLQTIHHPHLLSCLDVGHASLFSDPQHSVQDWISTLAPFIAHIHMNNNPGNLIDEHHALDDGVINYEQILPLLRALPLKPTFSLEMYEVSAMQRSLRFLRLPDVMRLTSTFNPLSTM
jgi:sugar phosphate isomerase/epimerase